MGTGVVRTSSTPLRSQCSLFTPEDFRTVVGPQCTNDLPLRSSFLSGPDGRTGKSEGNRCSVLRTRISCSSTPPPQWYSYFLRDPLRLPSVSGGQKRQERSVFLLPRPGSSLRRTMSGVRGPTTRVLPGVPWRPSTQLRLSLPSTGPPNKLLDVFVEDSLPLEYEESVCSTTSTT